MLEINVPVFAVSDHLPVCLNRFSGVHRDVNKHNTLSYRAFKHLKEEEFQNELMNIDFSLIEMQNNVDMSLNLFYDLINGVLSKQAPMKRKRVQRPTQPGWFNDDIKKSIRERDTFYKNRDVDNYKRARNKTISMIRKSKINFYNKAISENQNVNYLWKHLKDINEQGSSSTLPKIIEKDNQTLMDTFEIANILNSHFVNISNVINTNNDHPNNFSTLKNSLNNKLKSNYFDIKPISAIEVKRSLQSLINNPNKSTGLDGIGPKILKICGDSIVTPITFIINKCISEGVFPDSFKTASVIPLHKNGSKLDPNN